VKCENFYNFLVQGREARKSGGEKLRRGVKTELAWVVCKTG